MNVRAEGNAEGMREAHAEITRLRAALAEAERKAAAARDDVSRLRTALLFYAEKRNWLGDKIAIDGGQFARTWLERIANANQTGEK